MYLAKEEIQALKTKQVQIDCSVGRTEKQAFKNSGKKKQKKMLSRHNINSQRQNR